MLDESSAGSVGASGPANETSPASAGVSGPAAPFPRGQQAQPSGPQGPQGPQAVQQGQDAPRGTSEQGAQAMPSPADLTPDDLALVWDMVIPDDEPTPPEIFLDRLQRLRMADTPFTDYFDMYDDG